VPEYRNYCANDVLVHNSIYKFRGANPENTDKFYDHFPETKTYLLTKNFRSLPGIAAVANTVIAKNERKHAKDIITHKSGGVKPKCLAFQSPDDEAYYIASTIVGLVKQKKYRWEDFALIYRIRSLSRALEDALVYQNVPYRVIGANTFYNRAVIKDLLSYLRLVVQPHDNAAYTRIHNKPTRGIGAVNFQRFASAADAEGLSLLQAHLMGKYKDVVQPSALHGFRSLKKLFATTRKMNHDKVAPVMEYIIRQSDYLGYVDKIRDPDRRAKVTEDIYELANATKAFDDKSKKKGIMAYLDHVMLMQQDARDRDDNVVTLMTAHASKGTEFKNVFLVGCADGVLPLPPRNEAGGPLTDATLELKHYEEERRVFYVAVTRAEENLWITWPEQRMFNGNIGQQNPSQFIHEAADTLEHLTLGGGYNPNFRRRRYEKPQATKKRTPKPKTVVKEDQPKRSKTRAKDGGVRDVIEMKKSQDSEAWEVELRRRRAVAGLDEE
jgi:DNA helicase-2/ATP-dependent DNA helicase PcrA